MEETTYRDVKVTRVCRERKILAQIDVGKEFLQELIINFSLTRNFLRLRNYVNHKLLKYFDEKYLN